MRGYDLSRDRVKLDAQKMLTFKYQVFRVYVIVNWNQACAFFCHGGRFSLFFFPVSLLN